MTELPKDLKLKMTTKEGSIWENIKEAQEKAIIDSKINIEISQYLLEFVTKKAAEEKAKFETKKP